MSSISGAIKGGMAYVQAFLDDNPLTEGLAKLQRKLQTWQASLSKMGAKAYGGELPEPFAAMARFAASPAGAFAGLLGAAEHTATAREEMLRMSEATGVAIDKFSALAYAARRAGVSNEALASGLKRMQGKEFMSQMQAGRGGGLRGVTNAAFAKMGQGDAADKLREFIKLTANMPSEEKIGLARRMGLSELLPLINQGVDSLDAFTARAKELGLVVNEKDAKAGKQFTIALGDLHDVLMSSVSAIGGALVPMLTGLTNIIVKASVVVRDWIKNHKALTIAIFAATAVIVAGGIALKVMAIATGLVSAGMGLLSGAFAVASGVVSVFNAVLAGTEALLGSAALPFVLIGAAIVGVIGYIAYLAGCFDNLGKQWKGFSEDTSSSISSIANAIGKGDLGQAWDVATAYMKTEWQRLVNSLQEIWEKFKGFFVEAFYGSVIIFNGAMAGLKGAWAEVLGWMQKKWTEWESSTFTESLANKILSVAMIGKSEDERAVARAGLQTAFALKRDQLPQDKAAIDAATAAKKQQLESDAADAREGMGIKTSEAAAARQKTLDAAEAELKKKQGALKAAQANANEPGKDLLGDHKGKAGEAFNAAQSSEHRGTFSGAVAAMLGGPDVQQKQLDRLENIEGALNQWLDLGGDMIDQDGKLLDAVMSMNAVQ